ncbi:26156_t:CDS:2, partial [Gigaspora margarita]
HGLGFVISGLISDEPRHGYIGVNFTFEVEVNFAPDPAKGSSEGSQIPFFHKDLQRIGYPAMELEKIEGEDWG